MSSGAYNAANLDVCKCYGALSHIEEAKKRLLATSKPRHWMLIHLDEAHRRVQSLLPVLIRILEEEKERAQCGTKT